VVVHAECQQAAEAGDYHHAAGPPGPPATFPERDEHDDQEQDGNGQLVQCIGAFEQGEVLRRAPVRDLERGSAGPGERGDDAAVIGGQARAGVGGLVGGDGERVERGQDRQADPADRVRLRPPRCRGRRGGCCHPDRTS